MLITDVRQAVRSNLDDPEYDAAKIDQAINWFQNEIFNNTRTSLMETSATISAAANDSSAPLPADLQVVIDLSVISPTFYSVTKNQVDQQSFSSQFPNYSGYTARDFYEWAIYGRSLRFSAPVRLATTLRLDYIRRPKLATTAAPALELPDQYFELAVLGAQARVMEINEDFAEAAQIRNNLDPLVTTFIRNEARGGLKTGPTIMRTNRRRMGGGFGDPAASY